MQRSISRAGATILGLGALAVPASGAQTVRTVPPPPKPPALNVPPNVSQPTTCNVRWGGWMDPDSYGFTGPGGIVHETGKYEQPYDWNATDCLGTIFTVHDTWLKGLYSLTLDPANAAILDGHVDIRD